jgi:hypothetical protein
MGVVMERWCPTQPVLGVLLMRKAFLAGVAVLSVLCASAAHTREWQGNMPKPVGKLPPYPPVVCVTPNWTPEPCEARSEVHDPLQGLWDFLKWVKWAETNWLGTALVFDKPNLGMVNGPERRQNFITNRVAFFMNL